MSCPKNNRIKSKKPSRTKRMKKNGQDYIWKAIKGNPNLYCWIPSSNRINNLSKLKDVDISKINVQDIPKYDPNKYKQRINEIVEFTDKRRRTALLKEVYGLDQKGDNLTAQDYAKIVSVDDPRKYKIVKEFISRKKLKVYGGVAINAYLPREAKIYSTKEIPDYDVLSTDPWNDAVDLADEFFKFGYKYVETKAGINKGTYKVYVNLWPVADITYTPKEKFDMIKTRKIGGLHVVSPTKLLENMYEEYSNPLDQPSRLTKVVLREKLLLKYKNPFPKRLACSKHLFVDNENYLSELQGKLLEVCYNYIKKRKLIFSGSLAYNTYMEVGGSTKRVHTPYFSCISSNQQDDVKKLMDLLLKTGYSGITFHTESKYYSAKKLNNFYTEIKYGKDNKLYTLCRIEQATVCTPYKYIGKIRIVSIDYMKYDLLHRITYSETKKERKDCICLFKYLDNVQKQYYKKKKQNETDDGPFQRFVTTCEGPIYHNLKIEILNRWLDRVERNANIIKGWTNTHRVVKIPKTETSKLCRNKKKNDCTYPCAWNKRTNMCRDVPTYVYRPEDMEKYVKGEGY